MTSLTQRFLMISSKTFPASRSSVPIWDVGTGVTGHQIAEFRRNLYGDLAMWQIIATANYDRFCRELRDILDIAGVDSVLFGTDGPGFDAMVPNDRFIQMLRDLPKKAPYGVKFTQTEVDRILGENARKVFNL